MVKPVCPKCKSAELAVKLKQPKEVGYEIAVIYCAECGAIFGVVPQKDALKKIIERVIRDLARVHVL